MANVGSMLPNEYDFDIQEHCDENQNIRNYFNAKILMTKKFTDSPYL